MNKTTPSIDPHRPWLRDERDDPSRMDWVQTLFNPFGKTYKLHFSRAWSFMFLARVVLFVLPLAAFLMVSIAGVNVSSWSQPVAALFLPVPAMLVPFFLFTLVTEFTSFVAHVRRLSEANRSALWAIIILVPLMLATAGFVAGATGGVQEYRAAQAKAATETPAEGTGPVAGNDAPETEASQPADAPQGRGGRRGEQGPTTELEAAMQGGMMLMAVTWAIPSLFVMLWTLLYVARLPNGGIGQFRTGSEVTAQEEADLLRLV